MKLSFSSVCVAICTVVCLLAVACSQDKAQPTPQLEITNPMGENLSGATINFTEDGGTLDIVVKSNSLWRVGASAEWVRLSNSEGNGNGECSLCVGLATEARSCVVVIESIDTPSLRHSFNIVQQIDNSQPSDPDTPSDEPAEDPSDEPTDSPSDNPSNELPMEPEEPSDNPTDDPDSPSTTPEEEPSDTPSDNPTENPSDEPTDSPKEEPSDSPSDAPSDEPTDTPSDNPTDEPSDDPSSGPEDNPSDDPSDDPSGDPDQPSDEPDEPTGEPSDEPNDNPETPPTPPTEEPTGDYTRVSELAALSEGRYFIGGYREDGLHLAVSGLTEGHCNTAKYTFSEDGSLTPQSGNEAIVITLEAASQPNAYYIHFANQGYLHATAATTGALAFSEERIACWVFGDHPEGGFTITQVGSISANLTFSIYARIDALIRSIAADEQTNPIILWRHNK